MVSGWSAVMAIFYPTSAFVSVDLPVLGRPTKLTKPDLKPSGVSENMGTPLVFERIGGLLDVDKH